MEMLFQFKGPLLLTLKSAGEAKQRLCRKGVSVTPALWHHSVLKGPSSSFTKRGKTLSAKPKLWARDWAGSLRHLSGMLKPRDPNRNF